MKLSDFYFEDKAQAGTKMPILLPNGDDSGEWLNVVLPSADAAAKAGRAFLFAYQAVVSELEPLKAECEAGNDMTRYAVLLNDKCSDLNRQMAAEIVNGWSFEEEFSKEAFENLLRQYPALGNMVAGYQSQQRQALQAK